MQHKLRRNISLMLCLVLLGTLLPVLPAQAEEIKIIPVEEPAEAGPIEEIVIVGEAPAEPMGSKPTITAQPKSKTAYVDTTVKFTVVATGATSYQWQYRKNSSASWTNSTLTGTNTAALSVKAVEVRNGFQYRCKLTNSAGTTYSSAATLTVSTKPVITTQPGSKTVFEGDTAKFTVVATGATSYQWQYRTSSSGSWKNSSLTGSLTATLSVKAVEARNGFQYRCKVSNAAGTTYSSAATLTLSKPAVTTQPSSKIVFEGDTAKFTVKAKGAATYQWYWRKNSSASWAKSSLTGNQTATLSVKANDSKNGYQYRCRVSNDYGYVYSKAATLTVLSLPKVTKQPQDLTISAGDNAIFTVEATNADSYQWYFRSSSSGSWDKCTVAGATTARLGYGSVGFARNGFQYFCKISNDYGYVYSDVVTLTVKLGLPRIQTQPADLMVYVDKPMHLSVKAYEADSYQWYWRKNSSSAWAECTVAGATTANLGYGSVSYAMNGYQYRCKLTNSVGSVYTDTVTMTVNPVTYRALLVGEVHFSSDDIANRNEGNVNLMANMLNSVKGPKGGSYSVTTGIDLSKDDLKSAISSTFAEADANDVSLFYIATHGSTSFASGENAGRLTLIGENGIEHMTFRELADCLNEVPGTFIVILNSCGSGSSILENSIGGTEAAFDAEAFNEAAIGAFAALDGNGDASPNTGELRTSKFYVLTAAAHQETGYGKNSFNYGYFTYWVSNGAFGDKPADTDGNGTITLNELYSYAYQGLLNGGPYINPKTGEEFYTSHTDQHAQVYPENSSYELFK